MTLSISSPAFKNGSSIPAVYTCISKDVSPALAWSGHRRRQNHLRSSWMIPTRPAAPGSIG